MLVVELAISLSEHRVQLLDMEACTTAKASKTQDMPGGRHPHDSDNWNLSL